MLLLLTREYKNFEEIKFKLNNYYGDSLGKLSSLQIEKVVIPHNSLLDSQFSIFNIKTYHSIH